MLLVVLGGGAGLLAVWSVDPGSLRRLAGRSRSLRAASGPGTPPPTPVLAASDVDPDLAPATAPATEHPPVTEPPPRPAPATGSLTPTGALEVVSSAATGPAPALTSNPVPSGPARRRHRGGVPAAFTAVEGSWRDVAAIPVWRKVLSLVLLLVVLFAAGVALAAIAAAALGLLAELLDRAIG